MPNIDGGHYFFTCIVPVKCGEVCQQGECETSHSHALREELSLLPTATQTPFSVKSDCLSPFAHCLRTHFARFSVIDQPMWNGRDPQNAIIGGLENVDPLTHQPFDVLSRPWLLFAADFDIRAEEADQGLETWALGLWSHSAQQLKAIFSHCVDFDSVTTPAGFAAYLKRCQIDTTMSFNDYWEGAPPLKGDTLSQFIRKILITAAVLALFSWWAVAAPRLLWIIPLLLASLLLAAAGWVWWLSRQGTKPFPAAPNSDLPSVLKSLHIQQKFTLFAERAQGLSCEAMHGAFDDFLAETKPDLANPTQMPGVIRSDGVALPTHFLMDVRSEVR